MIKTLNKECNIFTKRHVPHYNKYYFTTNHIKQSFKLSCQKFFEFSPSLQKMGMVKRFFDNNELSGFCFKIKKAVLLLEDWVSEHPQIRFSRQSARNSVFLLQSPAEYQNPG